MACWTSFQRGSGEVTLRSTRSPTLSWESWVWKKGPLSVWAVRIKHPSGMATAPLWVETPATTQVTVSPPMMSWAGAEARLAAPAARAVS